MKRYWFKVKNRKIGQFVYTIERQYQPKDSTYHYILYRTKFCYHMNNPWEHQYTTTAHSRARGWSDEMGIKITDRPNTVRASLI